jgi:hypothetical protein
MSRCAVMLNRLVPYACCRQQRIIANFTNDSVNRAACRSGRVASTLAHSSTRV